MNILIIGGTGTLGKAVTKLLYKPNENEITILSRDELKQKLMMAEFPSCHYVLGDVKDKDSLSSHFVGKDVVFHFAAMKHIDFAEDNPLESIKTNILGTVNVASCAIEQRVDHVVFSSTDKAVLPINTYGMCKGVSEKYLFHLNKAQKLTKFAVYRWGNVLGSRGSVIHNFLKTLKEENEVYITHPDMTRFWIDINEAAEFMVDTYITAHKDRPMIPPMRSSTITKLAELTARTLGIKHYFTTYSGIRAGEKIHECIYSDHDHCVRSDTVEPYTEDELLTMIKKAAGE